MICLLGKTASGKTTIVKELVKKFGFTKIVTCTTRPPRKKEIQDQDYHFISEEEFRKKIDEGVFAEWKSYKSAFGEWFYGTLLSDIYNAPQKSVLIITPQGYEDLINVLGYRPKSIYINANRQTIKQRLKLRGDNEAERTRRLEQDNIDFESIYDLVDKIVYNNDTNFNVAEKVAKYAIELEGGINEEV